MTVPCWPALPLPSPAGALDAGALLGGGSAAGCVEAGAAGAAAVAVWFAAALFFSTSLLRSTLSVYRTPATTSPAPSVTSGALNFIGNSHS